MAADPSRPDDGSMRASTVRQPNPVEQDRVRRDPAIDLLRAAALGVEKLIYLTDVPGVLTDVDDPSTLISRLSAPRARLLIDDGVIVWATREDAPSLRISALGHDSREGRLRLLRQAREMAS